MRFILLKAFPLILFRTICGVRARVEMSSGMSRRGNDRGGGDRGRGGGRRWNDDYGDRRGGGGGYRGERYLYL